MFKLLRSLSVAATCVVLVNPVAAWSMMIEHPVSTGVFSNQSPLALSVPRFDPSAPEFAGKQLDSVELELTLDIFASIQAQATSENPSTTILQAEVEATVMSASDQTLLKLEAQTNRAEGTVVLAGRDLDDNDNKNFFADDAPTTPIYDQVTLHQREGASSMSVTLAMDEITDFIGQGDAGLVAEFMRSFRINPVEGNAASPSFDTNWLLSGEVRYSLVPIPSALVLMATGLVGLICAAKRTRRPA